MDTLTASHTNRIRGYIGYAPTELNALGQKWKMAASEFAKKKNKSVLPFVELMLEIAAEHNTIIHCSGIDYVDHQPVAVALSAVRTSAKLAKQGRTSRKFVESSLLQDSSGEYSPYSALLFLADRMTDVALISDDAKTRVKDSVRSRLQNRRKELGLS
jgi:hypothetical protein